MKKVVVVEVEDSNKENFAVVILSLPLLMMFVQYLMMMVISDSVLVAVDCKHSDYLNRLIMLLLSNLLLLLLLFEYYSNRKWKTKLR